MKASFSGNGFNDNYHVNLNSNNGIESLLRTVLRKGEEFNYTITVEGTGKIRPICRSESRYGKCETVLNADGSCENERNHKQPETEDEVSSK